MKKPPLWLLIVQQLLLTGLVLCVFALFHHVLPRYTQHTAEPIAVIRHEATPTPAPAEPPAEDDAGPVDPGPFTAERVVTDSSFSSPTLAFTVTRYEHPDAHPNQTYFVADVWVKDVTQLSTAFPADGSLFAKPLDIAEGAGALLAINADNATALGDVFTVRNGALYNNAKTRGDICVLYYDGRMELCSPNSYSHADILGAEPWQIWCFGPSLLDENGRPLEEFNIDKTLRKKHPRTVIGYYEPGHYCFVVIDGRGGEYSSGATIQETAQIMAELGCRSAYNLDGGASSLMVWRGGIVNIPSHERKIKDMIVVRELEEAPDETS